MRTLRGLLKKRWRVMHNWHGPDVVGLPPQPFVGGHFFRWNAESKAFRLNQVASGGHWYHVERVQREQ